MNRKLREVLSTSLYLLVVLVLTFFVVTYVGQRTMVSGSSMETTLSDGDNLIVDKLSYRFNEPQRYDIIVFPFPSSSMVTLRSSTLYVWRQILYATSITRLALSDSG